MSDRHEISFDQGPESEDQTYLRITGSPFCCCCAIVGRCLGKCRNQRESCPEMLGRVIGRRSAFAVAVVGEWESRGSGARVGGYSEVALFARGCCRGNASVMARATCVSGGCESRRASESINGAPGRREATDYQRRGSECRRVGVEVKVKVTGVPCDSNGCNGREAKGGGAAMKWTGRCLRMKLGGRSQRRQARAKATDGWAGGRGTLACGRVRCARASVLRYE